MENPKRAVPCSGMADVSIRLPGRRDADLKDDFFEAVNAEWLAQAEIPADSASVDAFSELGDTVQETLMADFEVMLSGEKAVNEDLKDFIEFLPSAGRL